MDDFKCLYVIYYICWVGVTQLYIACLSCLLNVEEAIYQFKLELESSTSILSPVLGPSTNPGVRLGGITAPYRAHGFGNGHTLSSTPFVEDFYSLRLVFTPLVTLTGLVVDTWTLGIHLTFLLMSHHPPHCLLECSFHHQSSTYPIVWTFY